MTKKLAARIRNGIHVNNLDAAIDDFGKWSATRPDIGGCVVGVLRSIRDRWTGHAVDPAEYRRVYDVVVPKILEILRRVDDDPEYSPLRDMIDLQGAYHAIT
jgi:hypothetical protein